MKAKMVYIALALALVFSTSVAIIPKTASAQYPSLIWHSDNPLPSTWASFGFATNGDYVYIVGGCDRSNNYLNSCFYASVNGDGSLGPWQTLPSLNGLVRVESGVVITKGYIYAMGGYHYTQPINAVQSAVINADGSIDQWDVLDGNSLPSPGPIWQAIVYGDWNAPR